MGFLSLSAALRHPDLRRTVARTEAVFQGLDRA
jgi:hypothetical protein